MLKATQYAPLNIPFIILSSLSLKFMVPSHLIFREHQIMYLVAGSPSNSCYDIYYTYF